MLSPDSAVLSPDSPVLFQRNAVGHRRHVRHDKTRCLAPKRTHPAHSCSPNSSGTSSSYPAASEPVQASRPKRSSSLSLVAASRCPPQVSAPVLICFAAAARSSANTTHRRVKLYTLHCRLSSTSTLLAVPPVRAARITFLLAACSTIAGQVRSPKCPPRTQIADRIHRKNGLSSHRNLHCSAPRASPPALQVRRTRARGSTRSSSASSDGSTSGYRGISRVIHSSSAA